MHDTTVTWHLFLAPGAANQPVMTISCTQLGVSICSEVPWAGKASRQASGSQSLVDVSSDFRIDADAYARHAHFIARVRAAEARLPMARATTVG